MQFGFCSSGNWTYKPIVSWKNLVKNVAWGAIFLLGAGLSVAAAFTVCIFLLLKR
jgi:di/tricarboxylate transporter